MTKKPRTLLLLCLEIFFGSITTVGSVLVFLKITGEVMEKEILPVDLQILNFFYHLRTPLLNTIMVFITNLGGKAMIVAGALLVIFLLHKKHWREALLFISIFCMAGINNVLLKNLVQRSRPQFYPLIVEKDFSFPSGHAMNSFVFYFTLSYLLFHITRNKKLSVIAVVFSFSLVFLIGISRVYLGVHYPSDVVGGYVGGFTWFLFVLLIQKTLIFYKVFKKRKTQFSPKNE